MPISFFHHGGWLATASFLAGVLNAVAGGGSFLSFPALLGVGVLPIAANATNTVALWPGQLTSIAAYREDLGVNLRLLVPVSFSALLGGLIAQWVPYPLVTGADETGISAAVSHLVGLGHRHILHVAGPENFTTSLVRSHAFTVACATHRSVKHRVVTAQALSVAAGESTMDSILTSGNAYPTAIVAGNDLLAIGILHSLREHGLDCPRDVSVIGFNDMPFAEDIQPPLTTIHVPHRELGAEAARLLLNGIQEGRQEPLTVTLPVSLIVRGSTARPAAR